MKTGALIVVATLAVILAGCGGGSDGSSDPSSESADSELTVTGVERVFVTRPFGGPLPAVLVYLEFAPEAPPQFTVEATGSDGESYRGAYPEGAKLCGYPAYLGVGLNPGDEGRQRTRAFIVPEGVTLTELRWRLGANGEEQAMPLPEQTLVCEPEVVGR